MTEMSIDYQVSQTLYIRLHGTLDVLSSDPFAEEIEGYIENAANKRIIIDMVDIDFINSLGLSAIIKIWKKSKELQKSLRILTNGKIATIFRVANLTAIIDLYVKESIAQKPQET